jgi:TolA-binding protein
MNETQTTIAGERTQNLEQQLRDAEREINRLNVQLYDEQMRAQRAEYRLNERAVSGKYKTYLAFNVRGEAIRVTVPEND